MPVRVELSPFPFLTSGWSERVTWPGTAASALTKGLKCGSNGLSPQLVFFPIFIKPWKKFFFAPKLHLDFVLEVKFLFLEIELGVRVVLQRVLSVMHICGSLGLNTNAKLVMITTMEINV